MGKNQKRSRRFIEDIPGAMTVSTEKLKRKLKTGESEMSKKRKKSKAKKAAKAKKPKGVGVIATILEVIQNDGPISKKGILKKLESRFPDRPADGMMRTISVQLPNRLSKDKKVKIVRDKEGRYNIKK